MLDFHGERQSSCCPPYVAPHMPLMPLRFPLAVNVEMKPSGIILKRRSSLGITILVHTLVLRILTTDLGAKGFLEPSKLSGCKK